MSTLDAALDALRQEVEQWIAYGRPGGDQAQWPVRLTAPQAEALLAEYVRRAENEQRFARVLAIESERVLLLTRKLEELQK